MQLSIADQIWNRAAMESGGSKAREGDRALTDLLLAHGMVMNGGLGHALEALSENELAAAARGYRFFGLDIVALLIEIQSMPPRMKLTKQMSAMGHFIPSDQTLVDRFEAHYEMHAHSIGAKSCGDASSAPDNKALQLTAR